MDSKPISTSNNNNFSEKLMLKHIKIHYLRLTSVRRKESVGGDCCGEVEMFHESQAFDPFITAVLNEALKGQWVSRSHRAQN